MNTDIIKNEELLNFRTRNTTKSRSIIKIVGVGGGGGNAVNNMYDGGIENVDFIICNTDKQALEKSKIPIKIHLGETLTEGLGAGNDPERGKEAAKESSQIIKEVLQNGTKMIFIAAGMGGGTGTGAAPVIAKIAKDMEILTVGIVTIPFLFEGEKRITQALDGLNKLKEHVDSMIVINNEKILDVYGDLGIGESFKKADEVITVAAKGMAEIITNHGEVNVDFADIRSVIKDSGVAVMGTGFGKGDNKALEAVKNAIESPLLNNNDIKGAKKILVNIISPAKNQITANETKEMNSYLQDKAGNSANIIWGVTMNADTPDDEVAITVVVTEFNNDIIPTAEEIMKISNNNKETNASNINEPEIEQEEQTEEQTEKQKLNKIKNKIKEIDKTPIKYSDPNILRETINTPAYERQNVVLTKSSKKTSSTINVYNTNTTNNNSFINPMID